MKLRTIACVLALAALATPGSAETRSPTKSGAGVQKVSPGVQALPGATVIRQKAPSVDPKVATGELKANLKINPAVLKSLEPRESEPEVDRVDASYDEFKSAKATMISAKMGHLRKLRTCSRQSYSAADQASAGCEPTDTVAQCSERLLRQCSQTSYLRYVRARRLLMGKAVVLRRTVENVTSTYVP